MPDGTIYAGLSPDTGTAMFTTAEDASVTLTFNDAVWCAQNIEDCSHNWWRLPTNSELKVLFNNQAAIG